MTLVLCRVAGATLWLVLLCCATTAPGAEAWTAQSWRRAAATAGLTLGLGLQGVEAAEKAEPLPLSRYFEAVRKELDPVKGESLARIKKDIDKGDWDDLKLFTREYDAGFRGGILKSTWKRLGENKKRGIEISNSFTFDLIGLNQAARKQDTTEAIKMYEAVIQDLKDFTKLEPTNSSDL